jgi:hypothetical protein
MIQFSIIEISYSEYGLKRWVHITKYSNCFNNVYPVFLKRKHQDSVTFLAGFKLIAGI